MNAPHELRPKTIVIAIFVSVAGTLLAQFLWRMAFRDAADVVATIEFGPIKYHPEISNTVRELGSEMEQDYGSWMEAIHQVWSDADALEKKLGESKLVPPMCRIPASRELSGILREELEALRNLISESEVRTHRLSIEVLGLLSEAMVIPELDDTLPGLWRASITNHGNQPAREVRLHLPFAEYASISRKNRETKQLAVDELVEVDTVLPREVVRVFAWSRSSGMRRLMDNAELSYEGGAGTVRLRMPASSSYAKLEHFVEFVPWGLIALIVFIPIIFSAAVQLSQRWLAGMSTKKGDGSRSQS